MLLIMLVSNEVRVLATSSLPPAGIAALLLSCVGGLGMSYFSFALRAVISATSFSVIGNICKVLTILVNIIMWDQHASERPSAASVATGSILKRLRFQGLIFGKMPESSRPVQYLLRGLIGAENNAMLGVR